MNQILPIILCGGSGTRMWPLSRKNEPKQFLSLTSDKSMFQETLLRLDDTKISNLLDPVIVCNKEYRDIVFNQLKEINAEHNGIILEPIGRNTAPAATIAANHAVNIFGNKITIFILPADHYIEDKIGFLENIIIGSNVLVKNDVMITFGIQPHSAHTGYGYIKSGKKLDNFNAFNIEEFKEKPDKVTAENYFKSGTYLWNSGMFIVRAETYLNLIEKFSPSIFSACKKAYKNIKRDKYFFWLNEEIFSISPSDSIDYAVMENCVLEKIDAFVLPLDIGWSDIGSWASLWALSAKEDNGNVEIGAIYTDKTSNSYLHSDGGILATIGIDDMIVVKTDDVTLVASKNSSEDVGLIVKKLLNDNIHETKIDDTEYTNWGKCKIISRSSYFKIRHLHVNTNSTLFAPPGCKYFGQMTVVKGSAELISDDKNTSLNENESFSVFNEKKYSIKNTHAGVLEIIQVQVGCHLD